MDPLHSLLKRQLKRHLGDPNAVPEKLRPLVAAINDAYKQFDADRLMLERSLDLSSQELLQANIEMRAVFRLFPDLFFRVDSDGKILDCNTGNPELLSLVPKDLIGKQMQDLHSSEVGQRFGAALQDVREKQRAAVIDYSLEISGARRSYEASLLPLLDHQVIIFVRDMTERKRAEAERSRLATATEQAAESIIVTDTESIIQYVNPAFERITGYAREEAIGQHHRLLKSSRTGDAYFQEMWNAPLHGQIWSGRLTDRRKNGTLADMDITISPVRDDAGRIANFVIVARDVSHELQLEDQLRQSQKMEAIGRLAGGIAHDFNNILTAIIGNTDLILGRMSPTHTLHEDIVEIQKASIRAASLISQLLAFSRRQVLHPKILNLNAVVMEMSRLLRRVIGENIDLVTNLGRDVGPLRADPVQLEQVIMNLALNARDAMPEGGTLRIETANVEINDEQARRFANVRTGPHVMLTVSDTGIGMDAETQSHLFEPFFTTKEVGKGTGLGLATVYGIVKQSGGHISVYSEPKSGTTIRIYLPRVHGSVEEAQKENLPPETLHGAETILLVEDEPQVRKPVCAMLQKFGYRVLEARNGAEAIEIVTHYEGQIHLLLTDVIMPGVSGGATATQIVELRPTTKIIYMSGHPDQTVVDLGILSSGTLFLKKPFTSIELARKVREVLDQPS